MALIIRGFVICGFDYPWTLNYEKYYLKIFPSNMVLFKGQKDHKRQKAKTVIPRYPRIW